MRKNRLGICIFLLCLLLMAAGCGGTVPGPGGSGAQEPASGAVGATPSSQYSASPSPDADDALIQVTSGGETTIPRVLFLWDTTWTGGGWLAADTLPLSDTLPEIAGELSAVGYGGDFTVDYRDGVSFSYLSVYDDGFERLYHLAGYDDMEMSSLFSELPEGSYYVSITVAREGKYIESENEHEYHGYDCAFKLVVD